MMRRVVPGVRPSFRRGLVFLAAILLSVSQLQLHTVRGAEELAPSSASLNEEQRLFGLFADEPKKRFVFDCLKDSECTSPGFPLCDSKTKECIQCRTDANCNQQNPFCDEGTCKQCLSSDDCEDNPTNRYCNVVTGLCQPCLQKSGCGVESVRAVGSQASQCFVSEKTAFCAQCLDDEDCPTNQVCNQETKKCVECTSNANCGSRAPVCDQDLNICVSCTTSATCSGTNALCLSEFIEFALQSNKSTTTAVAPASTDVCVQCINLPELNFVRDGTCGRYQSCGSSGRLQNTCVQCTVDRDCQSAQNPYCNVTEGVCKQCMEGKPCPDPYVCDLEASVCRNCLTDFDCISKNGKNRFCNTTSYMCQGCLEDADCGPNSRCLDGQCVYGCQADADCTTAEYPHCDRDIRRCVQCVSNNDCNGTMPYCDVNGYRDTCVPCFLDVHCNSTILPKCDVDEHTCVQCLTNIDCLTKGLTLPYCNVTQHVCQECLVNSDCDGDAHKACYLGQCVECENNSQCGGSTPFCNITRHRCQECLSDIDCPFGVCLNGDCVACINDSQCADDVNPICSMTFNRCVECEFDDQCPPWLPHCDLSNPFSPSCVQCTADSHCAGTSTPICDFKTNSCVSCISSDQCSDPTPTCSNNQCVVECLDNDDCTECEGRPFCQVDKQTCVECLSNDECCEDGYPICNPQNYNCVSCLRDSDCSPQKPHCGSDNNCYECLNDLQCPNGVCKENQCVACTNDTQCFLDSPVTPYCNLNTDSCVECTQSRECPSIHPVCNPFQKRCVECENSGDCPPRASKCIYDGNYNHCRECEDDPDCPEDRPACQDGTCVPCNANFYCNGTTPYCGQDYTCKGCLESSQCDKNSSAPVCNLEKNICVACNNDGDCPYAYQCDQTTNTCHPCLNSKHCAKFNKQHPICDTRIQKCVGCINDSDCGTGEICSPQEECTPGCRNDTYCLTPGLRACDTSINQCVPCTNNSYCPAIKPVCNITSGADICVECVNDSDCSNGDSCDRLKGICVPCVDDTDCAGTYCKVDATKPKQNKCVPCLNDSQCASNPVNKVCDNSTNTCVGCRTSLDCPPGSICNGTQCITGCDTLTPCNATAPICDLQTETCKQCSPSNVSFCNGTTPACKEDTGICVPCTGNSFCPSDRPYCDEADNQCYNCLIDANCGPGQVCDKQRRQCVGCIDNTDCTAPGFEYCDPSDQTCVPCYNSDQCKSGYLCKNRVCLPGCDENHPCNSLSSIPVCDVASKTCRQCINSTDCSGNRQFCANKTCVDCITSQQCIAKYSLQRPRCDTTGSIGAVDTCYECLSDSDCTSNPFYSSQNKNVCENGTCIQCDSDQNCNFDANLQYCNITSQTCTECTLPSHCASGVCLKGTCFDCDPATVNADGKNPTCQVQFGGKRDYCLAGNCVQCTGNGNCPNTSPICAKATIPGTSIQANTCIGCQSNSDCQATSPSKPICDTSAAPSPICVPCVQNTDCSNSQVCINNKCGCNDNFDCSEPTGICASNNTCVAGCQTDQFCALRYPIVPGSSLGLPYCVNGVCKECRGNTECPNNFRCSNYRCVQCVDSADCNLATYGYAANCVSGVCQKCQPTTIDTQNCPGDCQACPREKPVCKATPIPGTSPVRNEYSCITCASDANCDTDAECRGCICENTSGSSRVIQTGTMNSIQVSEKNGQSLSVEQCQGSARSGSYRAGSVSSRTVYDAPSSFDCFGPSVSREYDVRSYSPPGGGKFTAGERIWFYYSGYVYPDEFVITLGQCDILLDYDDHASVQGGRGGVLGSYASTSSAPDGCVDSINTRSSNPAGSSPCCRPSYNRLVCTETCAPGDKFISFVLDKDYDEIFVQVYAPCKSTRWVYMVCTDSQKSACTNGRIR